MNKIWEEVWQQQWDEAQNGDQNAILRLIEYHENQSWIAESHYDNKTSQWHDDKVSELVLLLPEEALDEYHEAYSDPIEVRIYEH